MPSKQGILVVLGRKGSGKSELVRQFLKAQERSIVIDTHGEYGGVIITSPHDLAQHLNERGAGRFRIAYQDSGWHDIPMPQVFGMLRHCRGTWIAFEEASQWTQEPNLQWFLQYGRHNDISVLLVARRPKEELDVLTRANADVIVTFQQQEPTDLDWIKRVGGEDAYRRVSQLSWENHEWDYVIAQHEGIVQTLDSLAEEVSIAEPVAVGADGAPSDRLAGDLVADSEKREAQPGARDQSEGNRHLVVVPASGEGIGDGQGVRDPGAGKAGGQSAGGGTRGRGGRRGTYAYRMRLEREKRQAALRGVGR